MTFAEKNISKKFPIPPCSKDYRNKCQYCYLSYDPRGYDTGCLFSEHPEEFEKSRKEKRLPTRAEVEEVFQKLYEMDGVQ